MPNIFRLPKKVQIIFEAFIFNQIQHNHNTEGMVLNILCNGVICHRDKAQYCKSFIDDTFSKSFSIKFWPVLGFLNTQIENKDLQFCNVVY